MSTTKAVLATTGYAGALTVKLQIDEPSHEAFMIIDSGFFSGGIFLRDPEALRTFAAGIVEIADKLDAGILARTAETALQRLRSAQEDALAAQIGGAA